MAVTVGGTGYMNMSSSQCLHSRTHTVVGSWTQRFKVLSVMQLMEEHEEAEEGSECNPALVSNFDVN